MLHFLYNRKIIDNTTQILLLVLLISGTSYLAFNAIENMRAAGITSGFGFLSEKSGYDINFSLIDYDPTTSTHFDAWIVGTVNTFAFSAIAIVLTTLLSLALAVMRLSSNWLLSRISYFVVEYIRNVPILVHIFVWYSISLALPSVRQALSFGDIVFLSNRGLILPGINWESSFLVSFFLILFFLLGCWQINARVHSWVPRILAYFGLLILIVITSLLLPGVDLNFSFPELKGFNFRGGMTLSPEFMTLVLAVSTYSAAHGSEVVRGSILAVPKGQAEAGRAMGAHSGLIMRKITIPQALRSIIPPMTSVYVNVIKAAALGTVIGFMDIMGTTGGSSLSITGQAIECIVIVMATYTLANLCLAAAMGRLNRKVQLKER